MGEMRRIAFSQESHLVTSPCNHSMKHKDALLAVWASFHSFLLIYSLNLFSHLQFSHSLIDSFVHPPPLASKRGSSTLNMWDVWFYADADAQNAHMFLRIYQILTEIYYKKLGFRIGKDGTSMDWLAPQRGRLLQGRFLKSLRDFAPNTQNKSRF